MGTRVCIRRGTSTARVFCSRLYSHTTASYCYLLSPNTASGLMRAVAWVLAVCGRGLEAMPQTVRAPGARPLGPSGHVPTHAKRGPSTPHSQGEATSTDREAGREPRGRGGRHCSAVLGGNASGGSACIPISRCSAAGAWQMDQQPGGLASSVVSSRSGAIGS